MQTSRSEYIGTRNALTRTTNSVTSVLQTSRSKVWTYMLSGKLTKLNKIEMKRTFRQTRLLKQILANMGHWIVQLRYWWRRHQDKKIDPGGFLNPNPRTEQRRRAHLMACKRGRGGRRGGVPPSPTGSAAGAAASTLCRTHGKILLLQMARSVTWCRGWAMTPMATVSSWKGDPALEGDLVFDPQPPERLPATLV
jgi:hypothetical protein